MNAQDVLVSAAGGAAVAFVGSLIISLVRAPKLLDNERAFKIAETEKGAREHIAVAEESYAAELRRLAEANAQMGVALRQCQEQQVGKHPADEHKEREIRDWLSSLPEGELPIIHWIFHRGPATATEIRNQLGLLSQDRRR